MNWPVWWDWELEVSSHLEKRMLQRNFTEIDLRTMVDRATGYHADFIEGRWIIETHHCHHAWEVVVEPEYLERLLVVITAYPL